MVEFHVTGVLRHPWQKTAGSGNLPLMGVRTGASVQAAHAQ
jgi:hypothetical protein